MEGLAAGEQGIGIFASCQHKKRAVNNTSQCVVSRYLSSTSGTRTLNLSIGSCRLLLSTAIEVKLVVRGKQTVW